MMPIKYGQNSQQSGNNNFHTMFVFSLIENDRLLHNDTQQLFHFWCGANIISIISPHCRGWQCAESTTCHKFVTLSIFWDVLYFFPRFP